MNCPLELLWIMNVMQRAKQLEKEGNQAKAGAG
jgi:hypothetical protein